MITPHRIRLVLFCLSLGLVGCSETKSEPVPALRPIVKMKAHIHEVPKFSVVAVENVDVPTEYIPLLEELITPTQPCQIDFRLNYYFADVTATHADGTSTTVAVRWTGHNPAAVSLDGINYYYGGRDEFPDGAIRILRILNRVEAIKRGELE